MTIILTEQGTPNALPQKTNRPTMLRRTDEVDGDTVPIHKAKTHQFAKSRYKGYCTRANQDAPAEYTHGAPNTKKMKPSCTPRSSC